MSQRRKRKKEKEEKERVPPPCEQEGKEAKLGARRVVVRGTGSWAWP